MYISSSAHWPRRSKTPLRVKSFLYYSGSRWQDLHYSLEHKYKTHWQRVVRSYHSPWQFCVPWRVSSPWLTRTRPLWQLDPRHTLCFLVSHTDWVCLSAFEGATRSPQTALTQSYTWIWLARPYHPGLHAVGRLISVSVFLYKISSSESRKQWHENWCFLTLEGALVFRNSAPMSIVWECFLKYNSQMKGGKF